jgi:transcriptional regulator with XRE-family HTH domain
MKDFIIKLRKANKLSQVELAKQIGISRPTLIAIEKGDRDITLGELKKISEIFDIPVEIILDEESSTDSKVSAQSFTKKSFKRFHNLILQCIKYGAADDGRITKTKLAKLVYLCDFASYYNFLKPISGFEYRKLAQGPVAIQFFDIIDTDESICVESKGRAMLVSLIEQPTNSELERDEEEIVKSVCEKWKNANTQEIVDFTHNQIPWKVCRDGEVIPYTLINAEDPKNVY